LDPPELSYLENPLADGLLSPGPSGEIRSSLSCRPTLFIILRISPLFPVARRLAPNIKAMLGGKQHPTKPLFLFGVLPPTECNRSFPSLRPSPPDMRGSSSFHYNASRRVKVSTSPLMFLGRYIFPPVSSHELKSSPRVHYLPEC